VKAGRSFVRSTANFRRNLEQVEAFLASAEAPGAFEALLARIAGEIIPNLERFPELGADFLGRAPLSAEGQAMFERAAALLGRGGSLRQLVTGDYILLYAVREDSVYLLSIRHHRQLSFDFTAHWP
jgi:plasmid stabilization system protein ParE